MVLGPGSGLSRAISASSAAEGNPRLRMRMLRHAARLLLELLRAGITPARRIVCGARVVDVFTQRPPALAQHRVSEPRAAAVGNLQRFAEAEVELAAQGVAVADQGGELVPEREAIARQRDAGGGGQPEHADPIRRGQSIDETCRRGQRGPAFQPSDVPLIDRDHHQPAVGGAGVRTEMSGDGRRRHGIRHLLVHKLCRNDPARTAVHFDPEIVGDERRHGPAVGVEHGRVDGDEVNAGAKGRLWGGGAARPHHAHDEKPPDPIA